MFQKNILKNQKSRSNEMEGRFLLDLTCVDLVYGNYLISRAIHIDLQLEQCLKPP